VATALATASISPGRAGSRRRDSVAECAMSEQTGSVDVIYHMCVRQEWELAVQSGTYAGSSQDRADGFIHFSTAEQLPESARRHRSGQAGLVLLTVDPHMLGEALRWEPSRHGALFPHLYGTLPLSAVCSVRDMPLNADGVPSLPLLP
jgi:uncharacterized protein (DUF952 family)